MVVQQLPTTDAVARFLWGTVRHVLNVEFCLHALGIGEHDPQRPHDIVGPGNKFQWDVLKGLASIYSCTDPEFFRRIVEPSIQLHRQQYHHRMWNNADYGLWHAQGQKRTIDAFRVGAVDAICSMLDPERAYQRLRSYEEIERDITENGWQDHHRAPLLEMLPQVKRLLPELHYGEISSLAGMKAAFGIPSDVCRQVCERIEQTLEMLAGKGYHIPG